MSQAVLADSYVGYSEDLAIFEKPIQNVGVKRTHTTTYYPINDYSNQGVIQFNIPNNGAPYLDLRSVVLNVTCKIVGRNDEIIILPKALTTPAPAASADSADSAVPGRGSGGAGSDTSKKTEAGKVEALVGVVNNFMHSMFSRIDVALQNKVLTHSDQSYPYLAYLKALLYTPEEVKNGTLQTSMYYKDTPGEMGSVNWWSSDNEGFKKRSKMFSTSKEVDMCGHLYSDVLEINRYIPSGVPLSITMYPSTPEFSLLCPNNETGKYKIIITKASLDVSMIDVEPVISVAHAELLKTKPAVFPYIKTEVKKFTLARGVFSGEVNDPFNGRVPAEMICGLVSDSANHGTLTENPFLFDHCNLNFIQVTVDGQDLSQGPIQPRYAEDENLNSMYMDAYKTLRGVGGDDDITPVSRSEYPEGYCLYRFFAEPTHPGANDDIIPLKRSGNMRVSVKFEKQLSRPMTLIIFAKFPAALKIDKNRAVREV